MAHDLGYIRSYLEPRMKDRVVLVVVWSYEAT